MGGNPELFFQISKRYAIRRTVHKCLPFRNFADTRGERTIQSSLLRRFQRIGFLAPDADSPVHRKNIGIAHFLQVVGCQGGTEAAAAIEDERSIEIGVLPFDIALDNPLAQMDRAGNMSLVVFAILADINEDKL